jgi:hypothetical protein
MNQGIANIIKSNIDHLDFVDKIAGLTSVTLMTVTEGETKVEKRIPIACCTTVEDCKQGAYNDLCPDSKYKSVLYFEDQGVSFVKYEGNYKYYQSTLRLVCWLNVAKLREEPCYNGTVCTLSSKAIAQIIRALPTHPAHRPPFVNVYSEVVDQVVRSNSIFGAYTYNEKQTQFLMYPFDYFALTIRTNFSICLSGSDYYEPCDEMILDLTPVAIAGEALCGGFVAKWNDVLGAGGYFIDVSTDNFATFLYQDLDVGHVNAYQFNGLADGTYYYRVRGHTGIIISDPSNVITVVIECSEILKSGLIWYWREVNVGGGYFSLHYSEDGGVTWETIITLDITETNPVIDLLGEYRHRIDGTKYKVDQTLTPLGYAGAENTDWETIYST